jgi:hypothetical protein
LGQSVVCKRSRCARTQEIALGSHAKGCARLVRKRTKDGLRCRPIESVSIDMGPSIGNGGGPNAADDMKSVPHCLNVYVADVPRDDSVAPERRNRAPRSANCETQSSTIDPKRPANDTEGTERLCNEQAFRAI